MLDFALPNKISPFPQLNSLDLVQSVNVLCDLTIQCEILGKINIRQGEEHDRHINDNPVVKERLVMDLSHSLCRQMVDGSSKDNAVNEKLNQS